MNSSISLFSLQLARQLSISINYSEPILEINQYLSVPGNTNLTLDPGDKALDLNTTLLPNRSPSLSTVHTLSPGSSRRSSYVSAASTGSRASSNFTDIEGSEAPREAAKNKSKVGKTSKAAVKNNDIAKEKTRNLSANTRHSIINSKHSPKKRRVSPSSRPASVTSSRSDIVSPLRAEQTPSPKPQQEIPANRRKFQLSD